MMFGGLEYQINRRTNHLIRVLQINTNLSFVGFFVGLQRGASMNCKHGLDNRFCSICSGLSRATEGGIKSKTPHSTRPLNVGNVRGDVRKIIRHQGPADPRAHYYCVGCNQEVDPALSRTGSVIQGIRFSSKLVTRRDPIMGIMETWERPYVLGGTYRTSTKKFGFMHREKGFLCDECCSEYREIEDSSGAKHPLVKVDPIEPTGYSRVPATERRFTDHEWESIGRR
jgi:hypothetical protein